MNNNIRVFQNSDEDYVLELWGGSTHHPDCRYFFSDFEKSPYVSDKQQIFQWLLECASKLTLPCHAKELTEYALENWYFGD